jgi:hypothetical protein
MDKFVIILNKKWFEMILSGQKKEDYREIKNHWGRRLVDCEYIMPPQMWQKFLSDLKNPYLRHESVEALLDCFSCKLKHFDKIYFRYIYQKNSPEFYAKVKYFKIKKGKEEWGADPDKYYFTFGLGEVNG